MTDPCQCHSWRTLEVRVWRVAMSEIYSEIQRRTSQSRRATRRWPVSNDWRGPAVVRATHSHRSPTDLSQWTQSTADHVMTNLSALPDPEDTDLWLRGLMPAHHIRRSTVKTYSATVWFYASANNSGKKTSFNMSVRCSSVVRPLSVRFCVTQYLRT